MTEKPQARLRPLRAEDIETVASFERDIAAISFPDDPITDLAFYKKKVGKLIESNEFKTSGKVNHTHEGSIGNLQNDSIKKEMGKVLEEFSFEKFEKAFERLLA